MFYWQTNRPLTAAETKRVFIERHEQLEDAVLCMMVDHGMKSAGFGKNDRKIAAINPIIRRGSVNSVIPVVLQSGRKVILRIHPKQVKNGYFWAEKAATDAARKLGVPTYETVHIDDSQSVVPFEFMIMTAVPGKPMADCSPLPTELEKKLVRETGKYAALIHTVKPDGFGFFDNQLAKKTGRLRGQYWAFKQHLLAALGLDLRYLVDAGVLAQKQCRSIEGLFAGSDALMGCRPGALIHNDIADWNELCEGEHITGMMDWDECFSGDPLMEVAAYNLFFGEPRLTWFKEGYRQIGQLENNEDKFQLFKLRYLISKMHLRTKRATIDPSTTMRQNIVRGKKAMEEVFAYFKF